LKKSINHIKALGVLLLTLVLVVENANAQQLRELDSLYAVRKVFDTKIYNQGIKLSSSTIKATYGSNNYFKSNRLYKRGSIMVFAGPPIIAGGLYIGYDAIKGVPKQVYVDGELVNYTKRSITQLIGGIGVFVVGICVMEYGNEFKQTSVDLFNNAKSKERNVSKLSLGITPEGGFGLVYGL
jgi:hypothetical protein